ncbi:hypothetical protein EAE69_20200 [Hafnia alvei ATCC 13337]|nr:hypothetical protein EAE69_20200 [Hafnia alvei ATCC 13337]
MIVCCIPQQNPALYLFVHKLIHRTILVTNLTSITQTFSLQSGCAKIFRPLPTKGRYLNKTGIPYSHNALYIAIP